MAITLTSQLVDESLDPGAPNDFGTSNSTSSETVIHLQGANCAATGHSGTVGTASPVTADSQAANSNFRGCYVPVTVARDHNHLHFWVRDLYPIRNKSIGGISVYIANGTTGEALYYMTGIDDGYGGGWYHGVVNLSTTDRTAADLGTLPTGNLDRVGYAGNISASKGESFLQNCYLDAVRHGADGVGISFYGGTSGARETLLACADADAASYGLLRTVGGVLFCDGCLTFGVATQTHYLQDSLGAINFTDFSNGPGTSPVVAADYYRIVLADGTTGVTNVDLTDWVWNGVSRALPFRFTANLGTGDAYTSLRSTYIFAEDITLNSLCTSDSDNFVECQTIIPTGITLTEPVFSNCDAVTLTAANDAIAGGRTNLHNTAISNAFVTTDDFDKITDHDFDNTAGNGHAIDLGVIAATRSDTCSGNTFTGYSTVTAGDKAVQVHVNTGITYTINVSGGNLTSSLVNKTGPGTLIVVASVTISFEAVDTLDAAIEAVQVSAYLVSDDTEVILADTAASGIASTSYSGTTPADIYYRYRKSSTGAQKYFNLSGFGTIESGTGLTIKRSMTEDDFADPTI